MMWALRSYLTDFGLRSGRLLKKYVDAFSANVVRKYKNHRDYFRIDQDMILHAPPSVLSGVFSNIRRIKDRCKDYHRCYDLVECLFNDCGTSTQALLTSLKDVSAPVPFAKILKDLDRGRLGFQLYCQSCRRFQNHIKEMRLDQFGHFHLGRPIEFVLSLQKT